MQSRAELLEKIAEKALQVRTLERELIPTSQPRRVLDDLNTARAELDELLDDLKRQGR